MRAVASRVVWFKPAQETLRDRQLFLAHVMTYGTADDVAVVIDAIGLDGLRWGIENAPPGIIDRRSWAYWTLILFDEPTRPRPVRFKDAPALDWPGH